MDVKVLKQAASILMLVTITQKQKKMIEKLKTKNEQLEKEEPAKTEEPAKPAEEPKAAEEPAKAEEPKA